MPSKTEEYLALAQRPAGAGAGVVTHAVLPDARDETTLRELSEGVIEKLKLLTDAEFAELEFPPD